MKKLIALLLALVMVLGLAACTKPSTGNDETKPSGDNQDFISYKCEPKAHLE